MRKIINFLVENPVIVGGIALLLAFIVTEFRK